MALLIMGIIRNRKTGIYEARKKVPEPLEAAVARVLGDAKDRRSWLSKSLGTRDQKEANRIGKLVLAEFDRVLLRAEASLTEEPAPVSELPDQLIREMGEYFYALLLEEDDDNRIEETPAKLSGLKGGMAEFVRPQIQQALKINDLSAVSDEVDLVLEEYGIRLDRESASYAKLSLLILRKYAAALLALDKRDEGEVIETPAFPEVPVAAATKPAPVPSSGVGLMMAYDGWRKARAPSLNTEREFKYAIERFIELHGDLPIETIRRSHARKFREALQQMPKTRASHVRELTLSEIVACVEEFKDLPKLKATSVNKHMSGVQTVLVWARDNGLIDEDAPWSDPFSNMNLEQEDPEREPWDIGSLNALLTSPVFTEGERPLAGGGEAAKWVPLLGLFTGMRLGEVTALIVENVVTDAETGIQYIRVEDDPERGFRTKTKASRRAVPIHPELIRLGFMAYVGQRAKDGSRAQLFAALSPGPKGGYGDAWGKWFTRYKRSVGITDKRRVFHALRHTFKDALRKAGVSEELHDALGGWTGPSSVSRKHYGAKAMIDRFGLPRLKTSIDAIEFKGLDLSRITPEREPQR